MKINNILKSSLFAVSLAALGFFTACSPDEASGANPLTEADLDASFNVVSVTDTIVIIGGTQHNAQNYVLEAVSNDSRIQYHVWEASDPQGAYTSQAGGIKGGTTFKVTFSEDGAYKVEHRVVGRVGGTNAVSEQAFNVVLPAEPEQEEGPNLVQSPNFEDPADWTVLHINSTGAAWSFGTGSATISGTTGHQAIYQAINVEAGKTYAFDMNVSGPGSVNTWFEVYVSPTAPTPNSDYSAGGKRIQLNTWAGCATSAFDGLLSDEQCGQNDVSGNVMTFTTDQTVYFLIKCGSGDGNINSITVSNVTFHEVN